MGKPHYIGVFHWLLSRTPAHARTHTRESPRARFARLGALASLAPPPSGVKWRSLPRSLRSLATPALVRRPSVATLQTRSSSCAGSKRKGCPRRARFARSISSGPILRARFARLVALATLALTASGLQIPFGRYRAGAGATACQPCAMIPRAVATLRGFVPPTL